MPKLCDLKVEVDLGKFGSAYNGDRPALPNGGSSQGVSVDHTYKLYYGGGQKRPDAMYSAIVRNAEGTPIAQVRMFLYSTISRLTFYTWMTL